MTIRFHKGDLPDLDAYAGGSVAIDTETLGLNPHRDRLCLVQLSPGDGNADIVQIAAGQTEAANLTRLLADDNTVKIWSPATGECLATFPLLGAASAVALSASPTRVACGDSGGALYLGEVVGVGPG